MRRILAVMVSLLALLAPRWAGALEIVATTPDLAAIAREVAPAARVTALALPTQNPHFVDARPNLALALARADALVAVGLELEVGWLPTLLQGSRNPRVQVGAPGHVDASTFVRVLEVPQGPVDRSMGDVHPGGNPHYLADPGRAVDVARGLAGRLGRIDPPNAPAYAANAEAFAAGIAAARPGWEAALAPLRGQPALQYHRSWAYLAEWTGLVLVGEIEPKPGVPPHPAHVARVLTLAQERGVKLIIQEAWHPPTTARQVAERVGARVVVVPGGAGPGQTYRQQVDAMVAALAGR